MGVEWVRDLVVLLEITFFEIGNEITFGLAGEVRHRVDSDKSSIGV